MKAENIHTQRNHCAVCCKKQKQKKQKNWNCQFNCSNCKRTQKVNEKQTTKNNKTAKLPKQVRSYGFNSMCKKSVEG